MARSTIASDLQVSGTVTATGLNLSSGTITGAMLSTNAEIERTQLKQETLVEFPVNFADLRVHDALATTLPGTPAADDLGLDNGTFGTEAPHVTAGDLKAAGATTRYARFLLALPENYDDAETVQLRINAVMGTTVADNSCDLDVEAYKLASDLTVGSDLCATAAQDMNSATAANKDFTITATGLASGDVLDVRVSIACNDAATGDVVEPILTKISLLADCRG